MSVFALGFVCGIAVVCLYSAVMAAVAGQAINEFECGA